MEKSDMNDLIEQYLDGTLSPAEKEAVEARIASDATFRAEVELHRQLQEEFADPQKLRLRDMLGEIVSEPVPSAPAYSRFKWPGIILLIFLLAAGLWYLNSSATNEKSVAPPQQQVSPPPVVPSNETLPSVPEQKTIKEPMAMATGPTFAPNSNFEARLGRGNIRSTGNELVEIQIPAKGADFRIVNGNASLRFKGSVTADGDTTQRPLVLKIFSNQANPQPLAQLFPTISNPKDKLWTFSAEKSLRIPAGQYYFTLERVAEEDLLWVGKFTAGGK